MGFHPPAFAGHLANLGRSEAPPQPPSDGPPRSADRLEVFGTGLDWVQLTWSALGPGPVEIHAGDRRVDVSADGGPGSVVIDGLVADTTYTVRIAGVGAKGRSLERSARTLPHPGGEELARVGTVSDAHLGSTSTGFFHTLRELPESEVTITERALRGALSEISAWEVDAVVVKGDLVDVSTPENWAIARACLDTVAVPVHTLPGNHEYSRRGTVDAVAGAADAGIALTDGVARVDVGPLRVVLVDDALPGRDGGRLEQSRAVVEAAAGDDPAAQEGAALVLTHHQLQRWRFPTYIPPGVPGPESRALCAALAADAPRSLVSSGHTHRHRRRTVAGIPVTEVGSTRDFPGTWAGYQLFEGGIVQTVRRIAEPRVIRWTDYTRRSALGVWPWWSAGNLDDRCFTVTW